MIPFTQTPEQNCTHSCAAWALALLGTVLYLIAYAADFSNTSLGSAVSPGAWLDLYDDGWRGRGALLRLIFIGASGWAAIRPERIIDPQSAMWAWAFPGFALVAVSLSRVDGPAAPIGFLTGVVHVFSVAIWFGGAALVARVVLAGPGEDDHVMTSFSAGDRTEDGVLLRGWRLGHRWFYAME